QEESDFHIAAEVVGKVEGRIRSVQQDVHAARTAREVIQRKGRIRGGSMTDDQEPSHGRPMDRSRLRLRSHIFIGWFGYYRPLPKDSSPARALMASRWNGTRGSRNASSRRIQRTDSVPFGRPRGEQR